MATIIRNRERVEQIFYSIFFTEDGNSGFSFPCDEDGNVMLDKMEDPAINNYNWCVEHGIPSRIHHEHHVWHENAVAKCECGKEIELYDEYLGACECPHCGRWHNLFGQLLKHPDNWGLNNDYDY